MKKKIKLLIFVILIFSITGITGTESAHAFLTLDSASEIISVINQYRVENGLSVLQVNGDLNAAAQRHSDYMASAGWITHTEPDGSTGKTRAQAEGYGTGYVILISEIIYGGWEQSAQQAIDWWKASPNHNPWILHAQYVEIGAGAARSGTSNYYTALLATVTSWVDPNTQPTETPVTPTSSETPSGTETQTTVTPTEPTTEPTAAPTAVPIAVSTPNSDGSVIHIVQQGQYLSTIAAAYDVSLETIYSLNGLNQYSVLYVGDAILIVPSDETQPVATKTPIPNETQVIDPTSTPSPVTAYATPTPMSNGAIIHIIQQGEILLYLAELYNVPLTTIYELNGLFEWSIIYPGDEIIIIPAYTPTPTATSIPPTATVPPTATPTLLSTFTPTVAPPTETTVPDVIQDITQIAAEDAIEATETTEVKIEIPPTTVAEDESTNFIDDNENMLVILIILIGLLFMLISFFLIFRNK